VSADEQTPVPTYFWVFWTAVMISIGIYLLVTTALHAFGDRGYDPDFVALVVETFALVALFCIGLMTAIRRWLYFAPLDRGDLDDDKRRRTNYFTSCILCWGLAEFVAVLGLALGLMTYNVFFYLPFGTLAVVLMAMLRPSTSDLNRG